jgi:hypothetical protein
MRFGSKRLHPLNHLPSSEHPDSKSSGVLLGYSVHSPTVLNSSQAPANLYVVQFAVDWWHAVALNGFSILPPSGDHALPHKPSGEILPIQALPPTHFHSVPQPLAATAALLSVCRPSVRPSLPLYRSLTAPTDLQSHTALCRRSFPAD